MNERGVLVLGEGRHELGSELDSPLHADKLPALPRLIHRLLSEPRNVSYTCQAFKTVRAIHGRGRKFAKKTTVAVRRAKQEGFAAIAIVIDRDRRPDRERIGALQEGRTAVDGPSYPPCALGVAVETFDAWMIADGTAVGAAGGDSTRSHPSPEEMDGKEGTDRHPKDRAVSLFGAGNLGDSYASAASNVDLELLARHCSRGFKPFADEVRDRIGPAV